MDADKLSPQALKQFTGSENWYRHGLVRDVLFTDGAKHVADQGEAYWFLDLIAIEQRFNTAIAAEEFQVWTLKVDLERNTGVVTCGNGDGFILFEKSIACTDFPVPEITLWFENRTIYLPSER